MDAKEGKEKKREKKKPPHLSLQTFRENSRWRLGRLYEFREFGRSAKLLYIRCASASLVMYVKYVYMHACMYVCMYVRLDFQFCAK